MGSALQPPFLRQAVAVAWSGKVSPARLRVMARVYFVLAALLVVGGFLVALKARGFMSRVSGVTDIVAALAMVANAVLMLRAARGRAARTSGG